MTAPGYHDADWLDRSWTAWISLDAAPDRFATLPTTVGVYRVRHRDRFGLTYIDQTGRRLRTRLRALRNGTYAEQMPYSDPLRAL